MGLISNVLCCIVYPYHLVYLYADFTLPDLLFFVLSFLMDHRDTIRDVVLYYHDAIACILVVLYSTEIQRLDVSCGVGEVQEGRAHPNIIQNDIAVDKSACDRHTYLQGKVWALEGYQAVHKQVFLRGKQYVPPPLSGWDPSQSSQIFYSFCNYNR